MTAAKFKIKKGDRVIVTTGRDKGKVGTVLQVLKDTNSLYIENVNLVTKHTKPTQMSAGGIVQKESQIHVSNVAILDPKLMVPTKIGYTKSSDGIKVRIAKKSGETL